MDALQKKSGSVPLVGVGSYISATCHFISVDWDLRDLTQSLSIRHKQKQKNITEKPIELFKCQIERRAPLVFNVI